MVSLALVRVKDAFDGPAGSVLFARIYILLTVMAGGLGIGFLTGGQKRFSGEALSGPRDFVTYIPGTPAHIWGAAFLVYAAFLVFSFAKEFAVTTLRLGSVGYFFFAVSLAKSVLDLGAVSILGALVISLWAILHLLLADYLRHDGWS